MRQPERRSQVGAQFRPMLFRNGEKYFNYFRIKLRSRAALNFLSRVRHWQRPAIRAVADHGVHAVSNGEYSGAERDLLALQSTRVAGPVKEFLVSQHNLRCVAQERNSNHHVIADLAVSAHDAL